MSVVKNISGTTLNQFRIKPADMSGAPTAGFHRVGEEYVDVNGERFICIVEGTPGTWKQINTSLEPLFQIAQDLPFTFQSSNAFIEKVSLTTIELPLGLYRIGYLYGWAYASNQNNFEARFQLDEVDLGDTHRQLPPVSPTGADDLQKAYVYRVFYVSLNGVHKIDLDFRSEMNGVISAMWEATIELWRVS